MPNRAHGKGVFRKKNGNTYEGEYKYDKCEGFGVYRFNNGDKYEGTWKNGLKNGQGTISWSNGCKFEGRFADDFPIIGELTEADGKVYSVTYDGTQKFSNGAQPESQKLIRTDPPRPSEMKAAQAKLRQETSPCGHEHAANRARTPSTRGGAGPLWARARGRKQPGIQDLCKSGRRPGIEPRTAACSSRCGPCSCRCWSTSAWTSPGGARSPREAQGCR